MFNTSGARGGAAELVHRRVQAGVHEGLRHVPAAGEVLPGRPVVRRRGDRPRLVPHQALRLGGPLRDDRRRQAQPHLGPAHRRRLPLRGRRDRRAVYVGGHQRYLDNPLGSDANGPGPGAVARVGIGALSPTTGKALPGTPPSSATSASEPSPGPRKVCSSAGTPTSWARSTTAVSACSRCYETGKAATRAFRLAPPLCSPHFRLSPGNDLGPVSSFARCMRMSKPGRKSLPPGGESHAKRTSIYSRAPSSCSQSTKLVATAAPQSSISTRRASWAPEARGTWSSA